MGLSFACSGTTNDDTNVNIQAIFDNTRINNEVVLGVLLLIAAKLNIDTADIDKAVDNAEAGLTKR